MVIRRLPPRLVDQARYARWVRASHALDKLFPALPPVIQGIGKVDAELCAEDADYFARKEIAEKSTATSARFHLRRSDNTALVRFHFDETDKLTDRLSLSALWLFGAYEAVRTLDQAVGEGVPGFPKPLRGRVKAVKQAFNRPRVLLAKFEAAGRHRETDKVPAVPRVRNGSLAWRVAPRTIVSRRALADLLLDLLERIAKHNAP